MFQLVFECSLNLSVYVLMHIDTKAWIWEQKYMLKEGNCDTFIDNSK